MITPHDEEQLVRSRWRFVKRSRTAATLFDALGIDYRKVEGKDFWEANSEHLPALYAELQSEARTRIRELHPDLGGDGHEFGAFIHSFKGVRRAFVHHGATSRIIVPANPTLLVARQGSGKGRKGFRSGQEFFEPGTFRHPSHVLEIMRLIQTGLSNRGVAKVSTSCAHFISKVRLAMPVVLCGCGRVANHRGWCLSKPRVHKFAGVGRPRSEATRVKMRESAIKRWGREKDEHENSHHN